MVTRWVVSLTWVSAEAGFGQFVKTYKPWFIGRDAFIEKEKGRKGELVRFRFDEKGVRMAHLGDPVVDWRGQGSGSCDQLCSRYGWISDWSGIYRMQSHAEKGNDHLYLSRSSEG